MQYDVRDEHVRQPVAVVARVEQGHVENNYGSAALLREQPPLLQNLIVIAPESVDALDDDHVFWSERSKETLVFGTCKVFAARFVHEHVIPIDAELCKRVELPVEVLVARGYTRIAVYAAHMIAFLLGYLCPRKAISCNIWLFFIPLHLHLVPAPMLHWRIPRTLELAA